MRRAYLSLRDHFAWDAGKITQMDVAERQRKLQSQREQRQRSTELAMGSNQAHVQPMPLTYFTASVVSSIKAGLCLTALDQQFL
jgi:hypothetical protein